MTSPQQNDPCTSAPRPYIARARHLFSACIPDLAARAVQFETDIDAMDDELEALLAAEIDAACQGLTTAIPAKDTSVIREHAHALQGMGGAAGIPDLSVLGEDLSAAARQNDFTRCGILANALRDWRQSWQDA